MSTRTKVIILTIELTVGGAEKLILAQAKHLNKSRFEPIVVSLRESRGMKDDMVPEFESIGIRTLCVGMKSRLDVLAFFRLCRILLKEKPKVLHTHLLFADWIGRIAGKLCGIPVIVSTLHALEPIRLNPWVQFVERLTSRYCTRLIAVSHQVKESIVKVEKIPAQSIEIFPNAVDPAVCSTDNAANLREQLGLPQNAYVVGMVGRLNEVKGHAYLFEAFAEFLKTSPEAYCVLVGDGPERKALEAKAAVCGITSRILFAGNQNQIAKWLSCFNLFVLPSVSEGLPMVILEAMSASLPIIATEVGGIPEIITDKENGILIPAKNSGLLAQAMKKLYQEPGFAASLAAKGRSDFERKYQMSECIKSIETFYENLIRGPENSRVKVLTVATAFDTGGVTTYLTNLIKNYPKDRFDLSLVTGTENSDLARAQSLGVKFYKTDLVKPIRFFKDLCALVQLYTLMRKEKFDIVHTNSSKADFVAGAAARLARIPLVVSTVHGTLFVASPDSFKQKFFHAMERFAFHLFHHVLISVSQATTRDLIAMKKAAPQKIRTIPNGLAVMPAISLEEKSRIRQSLGIRRDQTILLSVTRLKFPKAPEVLIDSLSALKDRFPSLLCLIAGDGPDKEALASQIKTLGLQDHVRLLGHTENIQELLRIADIFVLSSHSEGLSISVLEAMAAGLPIAASNAGGMKELILHDETGLLSTPGNAPELTSNLQNLLENQSLRKQLGENAQARLEQNFNLQNQVLETFAFFQKSLTLAKEHAAFTPWSKFAAHLKKDGLSKTLKNVFFKFISPFYFSEKHWFMAGPLDRYMVFLKSRIPVKIRVATPADLAELRDLVFSPDEVILEMLASPKEICFVAEHQGKLIASQWVLLGGGKNFHMHGFNASVCLAKDEAFLFSSYTKPEYRGQGIMNALQSQIGSEMQYRGFVTLYTDILEENETSISLVEKLGLEKIELTTFRRILGFTFLKSERYPDRSAKLKALVYGGEAGIPWSDHLESGSVEVTKYTPGKTFREKVRDFIFLYSHAKQYQILHAEQSSWLTLVTASWTPISATLLVTEKWVAEFQAMKHFKPLYSKLLRKVKVFYFTSAPAFAKFKELFPAFEEKMILLEQKKLSHFTAPISKQVARTQLKLAENQPVIGSFSDFTTTGNPWEFITAFEDLSKRFPQCQFLLMGDGPLTLPLKTYTESIGLGKQLKIIKKKDRVTVLKAMDIVMDRTSKPLDSLTQLEARAAARPIVLMNDAKRIENGLLTELETGSALETTHFEEKHFANVIAENWRHMILNTLTVIPSKHWKTYDQRPTFSK